MVLEALGVAPGGIWAPKGQNLKKGQKSDAADPPQGPSWEPKFKKKWPGDIFCAQKQV